MKKIKLSQLSTFVDEIAPKKRDLPPLTLTVPYADAEGNFVVCPLDTLARKVEQDLSKLRTFSRNNGLSLGEYHTKAQALTGAFVAHIEATAAVMVDHDKWQTEIASAAETAKKNGVTSVPSVEDAFSALSSDLWTEKERNAHYDDMMRARDSRILAEKQAEHSAVSKS